MPPLQDKYTCVECTEHSAVVLSLKNLSDGINRIEQILERFILVEEKQRIEFNDLEKLEGRLERLDNKVNLLESRIESFYIATLTVSGLITITISIVAIFFK